MDDGVNREYADLLAELSITIYLIHDHGGVNLLKIFVDTHESCPPRHALKKLSQADGRPFKSARAARNVPCVLKESKTESRERSGPSQVVLAEVFSRRG
jgi:hypothetical protein